MGQDSIVLSRTYSDLVFIHRYRICNKGWGFKFKKGKLGPMGPKKSSIYFDWSAHPIDLLILSNIVGFKFPKKRILTKTFSSFGTLTSTVWRSRQNFNLFIQLSCTSKWQLIYSVIISLWLTYLCTNLKYGFEVIWMPLLLWEKLNQTEKKQWALALMSKHTNGADKKWIFSSIMVSMVKYLPMQIGREQLVWEMMIWKTVCEKISRSVEIP